jgi:hypothetical protein
MQMLRRRRKGPSTTEYKALRQQLQSIPSVDNRDPDFRRLTYVRYADDFLLGYIGSKEEARVIKTELTRFLRDELTLELSEEKTLITHALTERAKYLGYEIGRHIENSKRDHRDRRSINGTLFLYVPLEERTKRSRLYMKNGKAIHRARLLKEDDYTILVTYQGEWRGFVQYYALAHNLSGLNYLQWIMTKSLLKTLAAKHQTQVNKIVRKYATTVLTPHGPRRCFEVRLPRKDKTPLIARFGGIPLRRQKTAPIRDEQSGMSEIAGKSDLVKRLLAETCELCGSATHCEVHHIRKLSDIDKQKRSAMPKWKLVMISRRRKTLVVCRDCHHKIHTGTLTHALSTTGEPDAAKVARPVRRGADGKGLTH